MNIHLTNDKKRSEPVQDIIDRMPKKFGIWTAGIVVGLTLVLLLFGWLIKYPDEVVGRIVINANFTPIKLVANSSGKITLFNYKPKSNIKEGDYVAVIQNSATTNDVTRINSLLTNFDVNSASIVNFYPIFPHNVSLGDINEKYYSFLNALQLLYNYQVKNVFEKQEENLKNQISELAGLLNNNKSLMQTRERNMELAKKIANRDSILLSQKVAAEDDADHSQMAYLNAKESFQSVLNDIKSISQQIDDSQNKLQQLFIEKSDKERQMRLDMISAYDDVKDNIKAWEQHYAFKSPMDGKVEFLKFWTNNQFIQAGEEVFTIIPKENKIVGQVELPAQGAGKVDVGQEVIIKLENYPYEEYGTIDGKVTSISLITTLQKMNNQENVDNYLVTVDLPQGLVTNYGTKLQFKYEIKGTAEIVNKNKRLIQRLFDNLKKNTERN